MDKGEGTVKGAAAASFSGVFGAVAAGGVDIGVDGCSAVGTVVVKAAAVLAGGGWPGGVGIVYSRMESEL